MASLKSSIECRQIHQGACESGFHCMSPVVVSISCSPPLPSALQIDPPPAPGVLLLWIRAWNDVQLKIINAAQAPASLRARAIIFSGSTPNAEVRRNRVFKVGFRKPCSMKATVCRDRPAFWASKLRDIRRFFRSVFNKRTTCELMASGSRLTGTLKPYKKCA
jgi:hypothetical protein